MGELKKRNRARLREIAPQLVDDICRPRTPYGIIPVARCHSTFPTVVTRFVRDNWKTIAATIVGFLIGVTW